MLIIAAFYYLADQEKYSQTAIVVRVIIGTTTTCWCTKECQGPFIRTIIFNFTKYTEMNVLTILIHIEIRVARM